jgi:hypothetical protein
VPGEHEGESTEENEMEDIAYSDLRVAYHNMFASVMLCRVTLRSVMLWPGVLCGVLIWYGIRERGEGE